MVLLLPEEVSERWRLSPRTIRELVRTGRLPGVRIGRAIRLRPQDVEAVERRGLPFQEAWTVPAGAEGHEP
jgi:excisionase family DNA binding protein